MYETTNQRLMADGSGIIIPAPVRSSSDHAWSADARLTERFEYFIDWLQRANLKEWTKRTYISRVRLVGDFLEANWSGQADPSLTELLTAYFVNAQRHQLLKTSSLKNVLTTFNVLARHTGLHLSLKTITDLLTVKDAPRQKVHLNEEQEAALLQASTRARSTRDTALVLLFLTTRIKISQATRLKMSDLIWSGGIVKLHVDDPCYPYDQMVGESLSRALQVWVADREKALGTMESEYLFYGKNGLAITPVSIDTALKKTGWRAGLTISSSVLRNTYLNKTNMKYARS